MCIDFTGLNKHCPKDPFALPRIDQIIDSTAGSELLCFLDTYSGYHQIRLKIEDELKTSFITPFGAFCYKTMPFGETAGTRWLAVIGRRVDVAPGHSSRSMWRNGATHPWYLKI